MEDEQHVSPIDFYFLGSGPMSDFSLGSIAGVQWMATDCPGERMKAPAHGRCVLPPRRVWPSPALCWPSSLATALSGNPASGSRVFRKADLGAPAPPPSPFQSPPPDLRPEVCSPDTPSALSIWSFLLPLAKPILFSHHIQTQPQNSFLSTEPPFCKLAGLPRASWKPRESELGKNVKKILKLPRYY